jgi:hypothetical protein
LNPAAQAEAGSLATPNVFILGAGKCGTTSLFRALQKHPQLFMPEEKEPSFFCDSFQVISNPVAYFNLFPRQYGVVGYGEASHAYFSSPTTAPVLRAAFPRARFLLILRNPANRAFSLYRYMRTMGLEPIADFEAALAAEDQRFADPAFRANPPHYFWNFMYARSSRYDEQLARFLALFPSEQFLVLTLGELIAQPGDWLERMFDFLGVDPSVRIDLTLENEGDPHAPMADATRHALDARFDGLRQRVEAMIGRRLENWAV